MQRRSDLCPHHQRRKLAPSEELFKAIYSVERAQTPEMRDEKRSEGGQSKCCTKSMCWILSPVISTYGRAQSSDLSLKVTEPLNRSLQFMCLVGCFSLVDVNRMSAAVFWPLSDNWCANKWFMDRCFSADSSDPDVSAPESIVILKKGKVNSMIWGNVYFINNWLSRK